MKASPDRPSPPERPVPDAARLLSERTVPGLDRSIFPIALSFGETPGTPGGPGDPLLLTELRGAIRAGVRLFIVPELGASEHLVTLESAAALEGPELLALIPEDSVEEHRATPHGTRSPHPRVARIPIRTVREGGSGTANSPPPGQVHPQLGWGVRLDSPYPTMAELASLLDQNVRWVEVSASLLDSGRLEALADQWPRAEGGIVVLDPFSGGRLDGGLLEPANRGIRPPRPGDPQRLLQEFAPVLPYGFLAQRGSRTLPQAALLYLLGIPRVCAVALPAGRPGALQEAQALGRAPPLSEADLQKIRGLSNPAPAPGRPAPGTPTNVPE